MGTGGERPAAVRGGRARVGRGRPRAVRGARAPGRVRTGRRRGRRV